MHEEKNTKRQVVWTSIILGMIILVGFLLRVWGVGFGLPYVYHADEPIVVHHAAAYGLGDFNPHFFMIPPFLSYMLAFAYGLSFCLGKVFGLIPSLDYFKDLFFVYPRFFYLLGRYILGVVPGTASIYVIYTWARMLFSVRTALISAFFLAVSFIHVQHSHYIYPDIILTGAIMRVAMWALRMYDEPRLKNYVMAGVWVGFATAIKYNGAVAFFMLCIAFLLHKNIRKIGWLIASGLATGAVFVLLNPFFVLDLKTALSHVFAQGCAESAQGVLHHIRYSLFEGVGPVMCLMGYIGMFLYLIKEKTRHWIAVSFCLFYLGILAFFSQPHERYALPLVPFICIYAAALLTKIIRQRGLCVLLVGCIAAYPFLKSVYSDYLFAIEDNRTVTKEWVEAHIPEGASIAMDHSFFLPRLIQHRRQIKEKMNLTTDVRKRQKIARMLRMPLAHPMYYLFYLSSEEKDKKGFLAEKPTLPFSLEALKKRKIQYVMVHYGLKQNRIDHVKRAFYEDLAREATLVARFSPYYDANKSYAEDLVLQTAGPFRTEELLWRWRNGYTIEIYRL